MSSETVNNISSTVEVSLSPELKHLEYYARHGAALFPLPAGSKAPGNAEFWAGPDGRAGSFKHHHSRDPAQWEKWWNEHPGGCNFGVVAFASGKKGWIIVDTDTGHDGKQTAEEAIAEASELRRELFRSWGLDSAKYLPQVSSARNGWHDCFAIPAHLEIDASTLIQRDALKKRINVRCVGYVVAAGSYYNGEPKGEESGWYRLFDKAPPPHEAPQALIDHCRRVERAAVSKTGTYDAGDVANLLEWMGADSFEAYEDWLNVGMALKLEFGDRGKDLWAITHNDSVTPEVVETKWASFADMAGGSTVTLRTFFDRAHKNGWKGAVRQSAASMFAGVAQLVASPSLVPQAPAYPVPPTAAAIEADRVAALDAAPSLFRTSKQMVTGFVPPDYLVEGVLQRRYCYSHTAQTGVGKTAQDLRLAAHVATGETLCGLEVQKGTVLYLCGENPTDVQMRWIGLTSEMGLDPDSLDVHFTEGAHKITPEFVELVRHQVTKDRQEIACVIVDTAAAHSPAEEENSNNQQGDYARTLRSFCTLPGGPCVLVLCHPTKGAEKINEMVPRGGGSFLAEVDGNLGSVKAGDGSIVTTAIGKFRGPEFPPLYFALKSVTAPQLIDSKGKPVPTVIAEPISPGEVQRRETKAVSDHIKVLRFIDTNPGKSLNEIGTAMGWVGAPASIKSKVNRIIGELMESKLLIRDGLSKQLVITSEGQKSLNRLESTVSHAVSHPPPYQPK